MIKKIEEQRFEFLFYVIKSNSERNIICQRYLSVKDFNDEVIYSLELKQLMDRLVGMSTDSFGKMGMIPHHLKTKSIEYLWKFYNPYNPPKAEPYRNLFEKEDRTFEFEIRVDKNIIAQSYFSGNFFPPQITYQVDIKELIPNILSEIKDVMSQKKYTTEYADMVL